MEYFSRWLAKTQQTEEEKATAALLFNDTDILLTDARLHTLAAYTYNRQSCQRIFAILEPCLVAKDNPWKTIYKALLILHMILQYGAEIAIDFCIKLGPSIFSLQSYNTALLRGGHGVDSGAPVRQEAKFLFQVLNNDENIRNLRAQARQKHDNILVPFADESSAKSGNEDYNPAKAQAQNLAYGQGLTSSVGAGFGLEQVPGYYEGRPERYFDNQSDQRSRVAGVRDHQITRDAQAPSLLDLVFDSPAADAAVNLPEAQYLPALQRQKELEKQLAEQQVKQGQICDKAEMLRKLQEQQTYPAGNNFSVAQSAVPPTSYVFPAANINAGSSGGVPLLDFTSGPAISSYPQAFPTAVPPVMAVMHPTPGFTTPQATGTSFPSAPMHTMPPGQPYSAPPYPAVSPAMAPPANAAYLSPMNAPYGIGPMNGTMPVHPAMAPMVASPAGPAMQPPMTTPPNSTNMSNMMLNNMSSTASYSHNMPMIAGNNLMPASLPPTSLAMHSSPVHSAGIYPTGTSISMSMAMSSGNNISSFPPPNYNYGMNNSSMQQMNGHNNGVMSHPTTDLLVSHDDLPAMPPPPPPVPPRSF